MTLHTDQRPGAGAPFLTDVQVVLRGGIPGSVRPHVTEEIRTLARYSPVAIRQAHVRLTRMPHATPDTTVVAEVTLEVKGRTVRVQVAGTNSRHAMNAACDRLRRKISQLGAHLARHRGRHRPRRPAYAYPPPLERQVVRHKVYQPTRSTVDEAVFDMELMDYDFYLFTDADTGVDSLVRRDGTHYALTRLRPVPDDAAGATVPVLLDSRPAPALPLAAAVATLDTTDAPFVFFHDPQTGRGHVLYRRHDGDYGLITPCG